MEALPTGQNRDGREWIVVGGWAWRELRDWLGRERNEGGLDGGWNGWNGGGGWAIARGMGLRTQRSQKPERRVGAVVKKTALGLLLLVACPQTRRTSLERTSTYCSKPLGRPLDCSQDRRTVTVQLVRAPWYG